ncbi:ImmA/IrrE family metallo-endopeptidase [Epibacterium sp. DP7N7-1]|nr:ImmA/IrrE family metallo-endopeptidase [Epibacterium sp. DP7N7-1]
MSFEFALRENEMLPVPTGASKTALIQTGERVREDVGMQSGFDLSDLVQTNSGKIINQEPLSEGDQTRAFEMDTDGTFRIYVSMLRSALSNNMIIATELGHRVLHSNAFRRNNPGKTMVVPKLIGDFGADLNRCKWEAFWFAQGLLMPEVKFKATVEEIGLKEASALYAIPEKGAQDRYDWILQSRDYSGADLDTATGPS